MNERPVRLTISDDLQRGRVSVFFRVLLALPFLIWLGLWAIAALLAAIVNWVATLILGRSPDPLHRFLARFVRYATHVYAYLHLAAQQFPGFSGKPGYAIDVEIDPPSRQNRWIVAFRFILAVPAAILASVFFRSHFNFDFDFDAGAESGGQAQTTSITVSLLALAAILGWFFAMARGRMPRGLRDLIAYALSYGAQFSAYLLLLTDRYPSSDPLTAIGPLPVRDDPVQLETDDDLRRSRLTVFFRLLLAIPHLIWLTLWSIVALLAAIVNWIVTLVAGTSPRPFHRFLAAYLRYQLHVTSYLYLIGNPFPGFTGKEGSYPIELRIADRTSQSRWTVLFRLLLAVPALLLTGAYGTLAFVVAFLGWFAALFTARMPVGLRNAGALALRYTAQTYAYVFMVTGAYPYSGPCAEPSPALPMPEAAPPPPPLAA